MTRTDSNKYEVYKYDTCKYMDSLQVLDEAYNEPYHAPNNMFFLSIHVTDTIIVGMVLRLFI